LALSTLVFFAAIAGCGDDATRPDGGDAGISACDQDATRERPCGLNGRGLQAQVCNRGAWVNQGACIDDDICIDEDRRYVECADDEGAQPQLCVEGAWVDDGSCIDDLCEHGEERVIACGLNGNGTRAQVCVNGFWVGDGGCVDDDVCVDDDERSLACGYNGRGLRTQRCVDGDWTDVGECADSDVCFDGAMGDLEICPDFDLCTSVSHCIEGRWVDLFDPMSITAGGEHTCMIRHKGEAYCWGASSSGRLGAPGNGNSPVRVGSGNFNDFVRSIGAGLEHTCAVRSNGTAWCWGRGGEGRLGNGQILDSGIPVQVSSITNVVSVHAGDIHTCARLANGRISCWGLNSRGQLGDNGSDNSWVPVQVSTIDDAIDVSAGDRYTCAVRSNGTVWCWGNNQYGQLGVTSAGQSNVPLQVENLTDAIAVRAGGPKSSGPHTCAIRSGGTVWCWGNNQYGQLGNESTTNSNVPVQAKNLTDVVDLAVGDAFACAVRSNGQVWCWGRNANGQLGQGGTSTASRNVPTQVSGITDAVAVTAGGGDSGTGFACVIRKSGRMSCWGTNFARQLGYSTAGYYSTSPNLADIPQD